MQLIVNGTENFNAYPKKVYLGEQNLCAYYIVIFTTLEQLLLLRTIISEKFNIDLPYDRTTVTTKNSETLSLSYQQVFSEILVELTTNSTRIISVIDELFEIPAPPWHAFSNLQPIEAVMSKQGELEYWWNWVWLPYWDNCTPAERNNYLSTVGATQEWQEYLRNEE
ncbi:hypothetical protein [Pseudomonas sp.]|uniref:hypothetical protein n=1 Tax=Pseudomonas sp. TaxID=306 RepID=UPI003A981D9B